MGRKCGGAISVISSPNLDSSSILLFATREFLISPTMPTLLPLISPLK